MQLDVGGEPLEKKAAVTEVLFSASVILKCVLA